MTVTAAVDAPRDPARLDVPVARWESLSETDRIDHVHRIERELDEVGIVSVAGSLSPAECDEFDAILDYELKHPTRIEQVMHERRRMRDGYKLYNLPTRHPRFLDLMALPFTVEVMRHFLGKTMEMHSSEGAIIPPGGGNPPPGTSDRTSGWHVDVAERIEGYFLGMICIYYLCDTAEGRGATRYIPGTHRKFITLEEALEQPCKYCPVKRGDLVIFNPYIWHAGSPNTGDKNRPVIINYYQRGFVKQGFDYWSCFNTVQKRNMTALQRQLLGFNRRVQSDIDESYTHRAELREFDPYGFDRVD